MVTSKKTLEIIRKIIARNYNRLIVSVLGNSVLTEEEMKTLRDQGIDTSNPDSLISLVYHHNFINNPVDDVTPKDIPGMILQQAVQGLKPEGEANDYTVGNLNDKMKQQIEKLKQEVITRLEGLVRDNNDDYKLDALRNVNRDEFADALIRESSLGELRQKLRDTTGDGNRNWLRVALTETSNAIGLGSVDRIVTDNRNADMNDVYVFKITVRDNITCKWCRRFYNDGDGTPKLYRLSTILENGSNYGKKTDDWKPVAGATHPNTRTSQVIELKPGFRLKDGGVPTYIGLDAWPEYIHNKLTE
jgi:hypothetical protein